MDKSSKVFFGSIILIFIVFSIYKYKHYVIDRQYLIFNHISCDPQSEKCFVSGCDLTSDPSCDQIPYKKITKFAANISDCESYNKCLELSCADGEEKCVVTFCSEDTIEGAEVCTTEVSIIPPNLIDTVDNIL